MKKVLIIEDHDSAIITIKDVLNEVFNYGAEFVVHKTFNKHLIEKEIEEHGYEFASLDLFLSGRSKNFSSIELCQKHNIPCVVFSANTPASVIKASINHGASGYLCKTSSNWEYQRVVQAIIDNIETPIYCNNAEKAISNQTRDDANLETMPELSGRQEQILKLFIAGMSAKEISKELGISIHGVNKHRSNMKRENGCSLNELIERFEFWDYKL